MIILGASGDIIRKALWKYLVPSLALDVLSAASDAIVGI